jgi:hypothetical protein
LLLFFWNPHSSYFCEVVRALQDLYTFENDIQNK